MALLSNIHTGAGAIWMLVHHYRLGVTIPLVR